MRVTNRKLQKIFHVAIVLAVFLIGLNVGLFFPKVSNYLRQNPPQIIITEPKRDFGCVYPGVTLKHDFTIINGGKRSLYIKRIRTNCTCTQARIDNNVVPPKRKTKLRIATVASKYKTTINDFVALHSNDPITPIKMVYITGQVTPNIEASPSVVNFGIVEPWELPLTQKIVIYREPYGKATHDDLKIVEDSGRLFTNLTKLDEKRWELKVTLPKNHPFGFIIGKIWIENNSSENFKIEIPIMGKIISSVVIIPDEIFYGVIDPKKEIFQKIRIGGGKEIVTDVHVISKSPFLDGMLDVKIKKIAGDFQLFTTLNSHKLKQTKDLIEGCIYIKVKTKEGKEYTIGIPVLGIINSTVVNH